MLGLTGETKKTADLGDITPTPGYACLIADKTSAGEAGVEPATAGFGVRCSSQLSYSPVIYTLLSSRQLFRLFTAQATGLPFYRVSL